MKIKILFVVFFSQILFMGCVNYYNSGSIVSKSIDRENIENGWEYKNNGWYYYDEPVNLSPIIYNFTETIDSTCVYNLIKKHFKIKVHTQSTGFYETSEHGWKWDDKGWSYKEKQVKSFPPSFSRKITQEVVIEDLIRGKKMNKKKITIDDFYQVQNKSWTWGIEENCWLLDDSITNLLPPYVMVKSTKQEITPPNFNIGIFN